VSPCYGDMRVSPPEMINIKRSNLYILSHFDSYKGIALADEREHLEEVPSRALISFV